MRRSPADSTNRSLAAFGKLQHIPPSRWTCSATRCGPLALSSSAMSGREQCHTPGAAHAALH